MRMIRWPVSKFNDAAERLDRRRGWDKLPLPVAMLTLIGLRNRLREKNLYDTGRGPLDKPDVDEHPRYLTARTLDGTFNDLDDPLMGSLGSRFGRNVPLEYTVREPDDKLLDPNPRLVSRELLTRDEFQPATTLNLLAGAWIQFEVHDWFSHGKNEPEQPVGRPARGRRPVAGASDEDPADAARSERRPRRARRRSSPTTRTGGTARRSTAAIPRSSTRCAPASTGSCGSTSTAFRRRISRRTSTPPASPSNFWVGLALLHSLFMREHNAICDHLHAAHPELSDDELYDKARLVVAALMAKIHTVDWTPAIIAHPTTVTALRTNWWGLEGERLDKLIGRHTSNEVIRGIPGSPTNHHGVPYSLTEEFVVRLPHAPADPGRLQLPPTRERRGAPGTDAARDRRAARARAAERDVDGRRALLVRHVASRRDHAAQLPALPPALRPRRRHAHRPRGDRRPARARARRAAVQPVQAAAAPQAVRHVRGDGRVRRSTPSSCAGSTATSSGSTR